MKYIIKYNSFFETKKEDNFPAEEYIKNFGLHPPKNQEDASKKLAQFNADIQKYNSLKSKIDDIYLKSKDDVEIKSKILSLMGNREDARRNPFLIKYQSIAAMKRRIEDLKKSMTDEELNIKDYQSMLDGTEDNAQRANINNRINDTKTKISDKNTELQKLNTEINKGYSELKKFIDDMKKDINKWIKAVQ